MAQSTRDPQSAIHEFPGKQITLRDGRRLGYIELGPAHGKPVFYCHGFPASRLEARFAESVLERCGVRMIAADRPGYGLSDFRDGRRIGDWPGDIAVLADALGFERFAVLGVSGGGPYAAACAASLSTRVTSVGIVGGLGRTDMREDAAGLDVIARFCFSLARRMPSLSRLLIRALAPVLRGRPRWTLKLLASELPPPDRETLSDPAVFAMIADSLQEALRQGGCGAALDLALYARPWEIELGAICVPSYVWHGEQDTIVPVAMGKRMAAVLPECRARFYADEGHFSLPVRRMDEILSVLV